MRSNVFVNTDGHLDGGTHDMEITHNTCYRVSLRENMRYSMALRGGLTNVNISSNMFYSSGSKRYWTSEGHYTLAGALLGDSTTDFNFISGSEVLGFNANSQINEANGINGGNPLFVDEFNPWVRMAFRSRTTTGCS